MVYSPYSIHTVMAMALVGSPEDSDTFKDLSKVLRADNFTAQEFNIDYSLLRSHYREIERKYKVEVDCEVPENIEDNYDYDGNAICDNKPDLDVRTGYRVYAQRVWMSKVTTEFHWTLTIEQVKSKTYYL